MIFYIVGMTCSGKDTVTRELSIPQIPSVTTRDPRESDKNMKYVTKKEAKNINFVESAEYCGNLYGTVEEDFNPHIDSFKIIEPKGLEQLKKIPHEHRVVYVHVPLSECKRRMKNRDGKIDMSRFTHDVIDLFHDVLKDADLLISGTQKGKEDLKKYIVEQTDSVPKVGERYIVTRKYVNKVVLENEEVVTKVIRRVDGKARVVFNSKKPGALYPISDKPYGITKIRRVW